MGKRKLKEIVVNREWCKGCGICARFCPAAGLELDEDDKCLVVRPEDCTLCRQCELRCPDLAIEVVCEEDEAAAS